MKKYFYSAGSLLVDPPVQIYPWDETVLENVYEGTWVIAKNNKLTFETQFQYDVNGK